MTRLEMQTHVIGVTGRTDKAALIPTLLNFAQVELVKRHDYRDLRKISAALELAADATSITLPAGTRDVLHVTMKINGDVLHPVIRSSDFVFETMPTMDATVKGNPHTVYIQGTELRLFPTNLTAGTIQYIYRTWPTPMATDAAVPEIAGSEDTLCSFAIAEIFRITGMLEDSRIWHDRYRESAVYLERADDRKSTVFQKDVTTGQGNSLSRNVNNFFNRS